MTFELPKGLPEGPWTLKASPYYFSITDAKERFVCQISRSDEREALARAIASIPDMMKEIERLSNETSSKAIDELACLRALNVELEEAVKPIAALPIVLSAPYSSYAATFTVEQIKRARAILAKAQSPTES